MIGVTYIMINSIVYVGNKIADTDITKDKSISRVMYPCILIPFSHARGHDHSQLFSVHAANLV